MSEIDPLTVTPGNPLSAERTERNRDDVHPTGRQKMGGLLGYLELIVKLPPPCFTLSIALLFRVKERKNSPVECFCLGYV